MRRLLPILCGLAAACLDAAAAQGIATSTLPEFYSPGVAFELKIAVQPAAGIAGYAVEDTLPAGWTATTFSDAGVLASGKLKWGPFFDATPRELKCQITPALNATGVVTFAGIASFDGADIAITGARQMSPLLSRLTRTLPTFYHPNVAVTVSVSVEPAPEIGIHTIEETVPAGWSVTAISDLGAYDSAEHAVKWGPFFDATPRTLLYSITPPLGADQPAIFSGKGIFDSRTILTAGSASISPVTGSAVRVLPQKAFAVSTLTISNIVTPKPGSLNWALQDSLPAGWTASIISDNGVFDAISRQIKWGPFFDDVPRNLSYSVETGSTLGNIQLQGSVSFDGIPTPISGATSILVEAPPSAFSFVIHKLPATLRPGSSFVLSNIVNPADFISVQAIQEQVPTGWTVSEISDAGVLDTQNRIVKWGPFFDGLDRTITCRFTSPLSASGTINFTGSGSFDGLLIANSGDLSLTMSANPNSPPTATSDTFLRAVDGSLTIQAATLVANDSDPDNDPLTVSAVGVSLRGVVVTLANGVINYTPSAGMNQSDSFFYTLRDTDGATATGTVTINVAVAQRVLSIAKNASGALVKFSGSAGVSYDIQMATTLVAPANWTIITRKFADQNGLFEHLDTAATNTTRFYRSLLVQ